MIFSQKKIITISWKSSPHLYQITTLFFFLFLCTSVIIDEEFGTGRKMYEGLETLLVHTPCSEEQMADRRKRACHLRCIDHCACTHHKGVCALITIVNNEYLCLCR